MRAATLSLKGRALKYLAAREHSRVELVRKLAPHAESQEEVEKVLDELESRGFLSAERFAESVVHRKAARYGAARVKAELSQHKLPEDVTRAVTQSLKETELERAQALWSKRFGEVAQTPAELARQMRFLAGRGFSGDVIRRVVKGSADHD
ncbi:recombination regulator RecX [Aquabacterium sp.]|uniref:recombination regulator RecX n=1 Tax=Aquabacterium sp. TaxID=1872578 RepID=UPI002E32D81B|nr:recombination regulator RecX [Aquabacterium sp.]HEX5311789.1 recombination regulator RecX [Aquabacterium sp.]